MERPQPRVALGVALRGVASAAIDLSDGLLGDLAHIRQRSGVGATLWLDALPRSEALEASPTPCGANACWPAATTTSCCSARRPIRPTRCAPRAWPAAPVTRIGRIEPASAGLKVYAEAHGHEPLDLAGFAGFDHFKR
jgi:thiamine-monophosphate kinase